MRTPLSAYRDIGQQKSPYLFCVLLFPYTWFFWGTTIFSLQKFDSFSGKLLLLFGLIGPLLITLFLVRNFDASRKKDVFQQVLDYKRIDAIGYFLLLLTPILIRAIGIVLSVPFGCSFDQFIPDPRITFSVLSFFIFLASTFLIGPLPEEVGWRGYLLDAWLIKYPPLKASLLTAAVWGLWQVPLFFVTGYTLNLQSAHPLFAPIFLLTLIPKSVAFTFFYIRYNRSILAAILLHFSINFVSLIARVDVLTGFFELLVWSAIALFIARKYWSASTQATNVSAN